MRVFPKERVEKLRNEGNTPLGILLLEETPVREVVPGIYSGSTEIDTVETTWDDEANCSDQGEDVSHD